MYGIELDSRTIPKVSADIAIFTFEQGESVAATQKLAVLLEKQNRLLFHVLRDNIPQSELEEERERFTTEINLAATRYLKNIMNISYELKEQLSGKTVLVKYKARFHQVLWNLGSISSCASLFCDHSEFVYWLEMTKSGEIKTGEILHLKAIPKNLDEILYRGLWSMGVPIILTSGTLSASGSFEHIKRKTGLHKIPCNIMQETSKASPFNYMENTLLYISENTPFPDNNDESYIEAIATETERLIRATHGHAAVLFTSYKAMDIVFAKLAACGLPFPLFRLDRGGVHAIAQFRESKNGVLFTSGALWEGIDLPGDILSLLVIVRLPFAVPDPISEYEKSQYANIGEYKRQVLVPEMIVKLKQGFGRLIRTEGDTGVVALLDSRVNKSGAYREQVLDAIFETTVTSDIHDVEAFIRRKKDGAYFT